METADDDSGPRGHTEQIEDEVAHVWLNSAAARTV
jgi:hypothetical protein